MFYFFIIFFLLSVGLLFYVRIRDKKYLSKKTKEVLSESVQKMIDKEHEDFNNKRKKFEEALAKAQTKGLLKV